MLNDNSETYASAEVNVKPFIRLGWIILLGGLGSFLLWAAFAPLDKGVVSSGTVMVDGYRKVIQSPVGGVVTKIAVKEGQQVRKGEMLVLLSQQTMQAQQTAARRYYLAAVIAEKRLQAELEGKNIIALPAQEKALDEMLKPILFEQSQLLQARQDALKKAQDGDNQAIIGLKRQRDSLVKACQTKEKGLALLERQLQDLQPLMAEGYYPRNRYMDTQLQSAMMAGDIGETRSRILELGNQIAQLQRNIQQRLAENRKDIETQLEQVRLQLSESKKQLAVTDFDLSLTKITAPQDGVVMGLSLATEGGVVSTGEKLMELVPQESSLIVDVQVDVSMIDRVHEEMPVTLMFTAFNHQQTPRIPGSVKLVSADRQTDPVTQKPYYKIQVAVTAKGMRMLKGDNIKPGMPVEVFIKTGERTFLNYLMKPIADRAAQSFTEE